ncbi:MAG TPA: ThuA domain-containing protein [Rhodothermales bacterium]|nr:ThuA domain-containing protein [Rhodothermales bacterium]
MNKRFSYFSLALLAFALVVWAGCAGSRQAAPPVTSQAPAIDTHTNEWITLYDGSSLQGWHQAGPGGFTQEADGSIVAHGGMGLFYYDQRPFKDFVLEYDWKAATDSSNSGVFVRFPEKTEDPGYAVNNGYEIQILGRESGNKYVTPYHTTGAIYNIQASLRKADKPAGQWNHEQVKVQGQHFQIYLNGVKVNDFFGDRGREGYIGLQNHSDRDRVWFKNIRVMPLPEGGPMNLAEYFKTDQTAQPIRVLMVTATDGFRHGAAIDTAKSVFNALSKTTELQVDFTEDINDLNPQNLSKYDVLFFNNSTLRIKADKPIPGTVGTWDLTMHSSRGDREGTFVLKESDGSYSGTIKFEGRDATELEDVTFENDHLTFNVPFGENKMPGKLDVVGDSVKGAITFRNNDVPLTGILHDGTKTAGIPEGTVLVSDAQKQAIIDFVKSGKGLAVAHAGLDAFYGWDAYREMVGGGLFQEHPWVQHVNIIVEDKDNPSTEHLGDSLGINDEIYVLDSNPRWNSHVLMSLDNQSVGIVQGPADATSNDVPISWIRKYGNGKVFVTKLGHFADNWKQPDFLQHVVQGLRMAAGRIPADFGGYRVKETIADNVWPDDIAIDERGNVWIAELQGKVHRYDAATGETTQIAQIQTTNPVNIEHGLYGIEVDPEFYSGQQYIYLYYAEPESFINTLSRFEFRDGKLDMSSEKVLLRVPTLPQCCHQSGDLEWGSNGTLMLSTGDTGMSEVRPDWENSEDSLEAFKERHNLKDLHWSRLVDSEKSAQNLQDLRGKILRINKDGSIPKDNPFYGKPGVRWEIFAYGLRNPYRFKYDSVTDKVYIGIVGPDEITTYDWYDVAEGGENFGWPRANGRLLYNEWKPEMIPNYKPPMWGYTYATGGRSASMGPIYRSDGKYAFPNAFQDKVFIYDWARKWIKWASVEPGVWTNDTTGSVKAYPYQVAIPTPRLKNIKTFDVLTDTSPISMELGPDGSLYVAEFTGFWGPAPGSKVTRYRWIDHDQPLATEPTASSTGTK